MPMISLQVTDEEKKIIEDYAKSHDMSVTEIILEIFFKKSEDEFDLKVIAEYEADPDKTTYSHAEVKKMLGIEN
ncbi:MAG: antitoxin [Eubacteriaceae bacterium]|nr:antitoxin [Eubacteriaceae bacterium]